ncbi:MFS transporter [Arthrobacter cryoconiti]|uniref:MFS transporter n=1 Tax=Arthrobacter cryoconiti TaxID=748907 RepID=A0ABV8QZA7_9MICC|nr:MFS transporter [Arthrobacter cryoconiti]MCC9067727.1 MFS transporter [Arthrobacter cryoconiti]
MSVESRNYKKAKLGSREPPVSLRSAWLPLATLSAVFLFEMLDNSILNIALPSIGRELQASSTALQWATSAYAVMFGSLMLVFGAAADRFGRRRIMLIGLALLAVASLAIIFVTTAEELVLVRAVMGVAAAMTTPGSMALAFRLFAAEELRIRAITLISTVGLVGLAVGPVAGGFVLAIAPWQSLLLVNAPIAILAMIGLWLGFAADESSELHDAPLDIPGSALGTLTILLILVAPTLFVDEGADSWEPWVLTVGSVIAGALFIRRQRTARHPLLELELIARPLVSSALAFKAAAGLATAGLGYLVTLQFQLQWGWPPALAALGLLPQVIVLIGGGAFVSPFVKRVGQVRAAGISAVAVVAGLAVYSLLNSFGYVFVAIALALVAAGLRVVGVVAATNVLSGLPANRTTIGAALTDTATEVANGVGVAVAGTILAAIFAGSIATSNWDSEQTAQFQAGVTIGGLVLTSLAAALAGWGFRQTKRLTRSPETRKSSGTQVPEDRVGLQTESNC